MVIKYLKRKESSGYIFIFLLAFLLWLSGFVVNPTVDIYGNMPLYELWIKPLLSVPVLPLIMALILLLTGAYLLNNIAVENELVSEPSNLTALMYVVFMSIHISMLSLHPILISNVFLLLSLRSLTKSYRKQESFSNVFDTGVYFSIAMLFYGPTAYVFPVLCVGLFLIRPLDWREWVIMLFGIIVPFLFVLTYYYWNDQLLELLDGKLFKWVKEKAPNSYSSSFFVIVGLAGLLTLLSAKNYIRHFLGSSQRKMISTYLFFGISVLGLSSLLSASSSSVMFYSIFILPLSVFTAEYFLKAKNLRWANFLFYLLLISIVVNLLSAFI